MKQCFYGFLLAIQFLTRLPVPVQCPWNKETSKWAIRCYPIVGVIIGIVMIFVIWLLQPFVPSVMLALIIMTLWVWITGGLHLDGWIDVADAVGSNAPLEKKWEIMKDPRVGSFGILALLFLLAWKTMFIYMLFDINDQLIYAFFVILAMSRLGAVFLMFFLPDAKKQGLAWEWKKNLNGMDVVYASLPTVALLFVFPEYLFLIPAYFLALFLYALWIKRAFKGINGDLLGTAIEGGELWGLAITWIYFSFVMG
ncbi:adenosylcobinamide-GDP ribazoletransferase [Alteribacter populi]|uniref:adenosylcobinamide-GDP ribazoletransferase n=1 Tax=Alteribacter populi TaxID=2011011 RepID=UPI000BBB58EC|nr:adenosylcobinamide-GDP ribazoletransferase [Alteribacter populi]